MYCCHPERPPLTLLSLKEPERMKYRVLLAAMLTLLDSALLWEVQTTNKSRLARLATSGLHVSGHREPDVDHWQEGISLDKQSRHS
jgi:hypothetical protein